MEDLLKKIDKKMEINKSDIEKISDILINKKFFVLEVFDKNKNVVDNVSFARGLSAKLYNMDMPHIYINGFREKEKYKEKEDVIVVFNSKDIDFSKWTEKIKEIEEKDKNIKPFYFDTTNKETFDIKEVESLLGENFYFETLRPFTNYGKANKDKYRFIGKK